MRYSLILLFLIVFVSCNRYNSYRDQYTFRSSSGAPLYEQLDYWAAHPWKWDPSDSIPEPLRTGVKDSTTDVFFIYPTSYTKRKYDRSVNAPIDKDLVNAKTDYTSILYQASAFNEQSRIFAPRYRQAHISNFFTKDTAAARIAFDIAYEDIRTAFRYYLQNWNNGRPLIMASHSQGSYLMERLLKEFFEGKPLKNKLVVAYVIGWPVPKDYSSSLKMCVDSFQTGCICSWRTVHKGFVPRYSRKEKGNAWVTNPLNWKMTDEYAPRSMNKGSVLKNFNKIHLNTTDAWISNGFLYSRKPKFPGSIFFFTRNYHIGDINLFYVNLREDVKRRIGLYWKTL